MGLSLRSYEHRSSSANLDLETCRKSDEKVKKLHKNCPKFDENMTSDLLRV